jgi:predicted DNA-binding transcriptional regulator AlpA
MKTHTHRKARRENSLVAPEHPDPSASEGRAVASPTPQQAPSQRRVERLRDVAARTCRSRSSIWRDIRDGHFPIPVKLSEGRSIGFFSDEVDEWISSRPRARRSTDSDQPSSPELPEVLR